MILRLVIGLVFAWAFAGLVFVAWTGAAAGPGSPVILQYGFYATAGFALLFTVFFLYRSHSEYVLTGDGHAFTVVKVFRFLCYMLLAGAILAIGFRPGWFFPQG
jgi:hypothetical protein